MQNLKLIAIFSVVSLSFSSAMLPSVAWSKRKTINIYEQFSIEDKPLLKTKKLNNISNIQLQKRTTSLSAKKLTEQNTEDMFANEDDGLEKIKIETSQLPDPHLNNSTVY